MKNRFLFLTAVLLALCLSACATDDAIPEMSDEELQMVEEYAAHLLLKYDANYKPATITDDELAEERARIERLAAVQQQIEEERAAREAEKEAEKNSKGNDSSSGAEAGKESSGPVYTDIDEFFGISGLDIAFAGYTVCDSYPEELGENDWQGVVNATAGNSLLVFKYGINNDSGNDIWLDMTAYSPRFTFRINNDFSKAAMMTMLLNDFALYRGNIAAGESTEAVLVVELTAAQAEDIESLTMIMRYADSRGELTLK